MLKPTAGPFPAAAEQYLHVGTLLQITPAKCIR